MDQRRRHLLIAGALMPLVSASACTAPAPLTRIGSITWLGYEPLFLARELGLYDRQTLRLVEMPSSTDNLMSLAIGDLEAATLTLDEFLQARQGGLDVRVILVFDESAGADVVMAKPGITRLKALKGKRVGVEDTAVGALMLAKTLEAAGLEPRDIIKVPLTIESHVRTYQADEVDAVVTFEPFATQLEEAGALRLYDSNQFPGLIVDVLVARADALERSPQPFRQLVAGYFQALAYLRASPDDALRLMAPRLGISPEAMGVSLKGIHLMDLAANHRWLAGERPGLIPTIGRVAQTMLAEGLLKQSPAMHGLIDSRFLPESK